LSQQTEDEFITNCVTGAERTLLKNKLKIQCWIQTSRG